MHSFLHLNSTLSVRLRILHNSMIDFFTRLFAWFIDWLIARETIQVKGSVDAEMNADNQPQTYFSYRFSNVRVVLSVFARTFAHSHNISIEPSHKWIDLIGYLASIFLPITLSGITQAYYQVPNYGFHARITDFDFVWAKVRKCMHFRHDVTAFDD